MGDHHFNHAICNPTIAAAPHAIINSYKNVLAVAIEVDYSFPLAEKVKEYLKKIQFNLKLLLVQFTCSYCAVWA